MFEAAAQFTEIGAGIIFWPRTWNVLKALGVKDEVIDGFRTQPSECTKGEPFHTTGQKLTDLALPLEPQVQHGVSESQIRAKE